MNFPFYQGILISLPDPFKNRIQSAQKWTCMTGAGISAESGIPTFRDAQEGYWENYSPEDLASASGFARNPSLVWSWYQERRRKICAAKPNPGHQVLARMEKRFDCWTLITQNVDELHQRAGSKNVLELHGSIHRAICFESRHQVPTWEENEGEVPSCPECGSLLRPDVVWFGETLDESILKAAMESANNCDLFLSIGTSSLVYPAAGLAYEAREKGAYIVEINPHKTPLSDQADFHMEMSASEALPLIENLLKTD